MRNIEDVTTTDRGNETHPAFGVLTLSQAQGQPRHLFQSDVAHQHTVRLEISTAERDRKHGHDYVHPRQKVVEVEMSLAQWGEVVSSVGIGSGTPVTLRYTQGEGALPGIPFESRAVKARTEVEDAVKDLLAEATEAMSALNEVEENKGGVRARREARRRLEAALRNASANAGFAVQTLDEAVERTVAQARTDIEASVLKAHNAFAGQGGPELDAATFDESLPEIEATVVGEDSGD